MKVSSFLYRKDLDKSMMNKIFSGESPSNNGSTLKTINQPKRSFPNPGAPERPEEFAPGLT